MRVHIAGTVGDRSATLRHRTGRLRYAIFSDARPRLAKGDALPVADATQLVLVLGDERVGGGRLTPLDKSNLLQTVFSGLVHGDLPAAPSPGADWTRSHGRPDRGGGGRRGPESAALFCAMMHHATAGSAHRILLSSFAMLERLTSRGWRITPLGAPALIAGRPAVVAWVERRAVALHPGRRARRRRAPAPAAGRRQLH